MRQEFENDVRRIIKTNIEMAFYMKGGISYDDMMHRTFAERQLIHEFIGERFEAQEKAMFVTTM